MDFPELDEFGRPREKLPNCPRCGEDELGVIHNELCLCYSCGFKVTSVHTFPPRNESGGISRHLGSVSRR